MQNVKVETPFQRDVCEVLETANLMTKLETAGSVDDWLAATSSRSLNSIAHMFPLLSALFLTREEPEQAILTLQLLLESVKQDPMLASSLLTLITHRLGRNPAPRLTLALLHALPSMATDKGCIALIMKLVSSLSSRPSVAPVRLSLLVRLWKVETRCFPLLQAALAQTNVSGPEWQVAQALAIKEVVTSHASQHGSDLLPLLSNLINQAEGEEGATAASLALEGIAVLCREGVIDMRTTAKVLAPKCCSDSRPRVLCSYIRLIALVPTFNAAGQDYADFTSSSLFWLWSQVDSTLSGVSEAAYKAISAFPPESTTLRMIPEQARIGLRLPARYCGTPEEAARPVEDVLDYVPGECWPQLLNSPSAAILVGELLKKEVLGLPRPLYAQSTGAEPGFYSHLAEASVLRGLVNMVQAKCQPPPHPSITAKASSLLSNILSLLASDIGRPLPPLDWTFLDSLHDSATLRPAVIELLCRQAWSSRTARALVERNLASDLDCDTAQAYMQHLLLVSKAVPAPLLGLFVLNSLTRVKESGRIEELKMMLSKVEEVLKDPELPAASLESLVRTMEELLDCILPEEEELFDLHLGAAILLPLPTLQELSSPSNCGLRRAVLYRSALARSQGTKTRLTCLNDVIEAACNVHHCPELLPALQTPQNSSRDGRHRGYL